MWQMKLVMHVAKLEVKHLHKNGEEVSFVGGAGKINSIGKTYVSWKNEWDMLLKKWCLLNYAWKTDVTKIDEKNR